MDKEIHSKRNVENAGQICRRIKEDSEREARDILDKAQRDKQRILGEAKLEAENKKAEILKDLDRDLQKIKERIFSTLNLEKKKLFLEEKDRLVGLILKEVKKMAEGFRNSQDYKNFLERAILEGIEVVSHDDIDIFYSFLDDKIIKDGFTSNVENLCHNKFNKNFSFKFRNSDFKDIGVIVQSGDGRLTYDNRFLPRLKRAYDEVYMKLLKGAF